MKEKALSVINTHLAGTLSLRAESIEVATSGSQAKEIQYRPTPAASQAIKKNAQISINLEMWEEKA